MCARLEEVVERRLVPQREREREQEVADGGDPEAPLARSLGDPGEHGCLAGPGDREPAAGQELRGGDRAGRQADGPEEGGKVAGAPQERGAEHEVGGGDDEQRQALAAPAGDVPVEELRRRAGRERRRREQDADRERVERLRLRGELDDRGDRDVERPEENGEPDDGPVRRLALKDEADDLRERGDEAGDQERGPALAQRHHRDCREDERGEGRSNESELALFDEGHERDEERADEAEGGDELLLPAEGDDSRHGGDARRSGEGAEVRHEPVERGGREQGRVRAGDSGPDRGERRVRRPEALAQPEAGSEDAHGGGGAEGEAQLGADPAPVRREDEEEDDPEHGHDPAGDGKPERAEERGVVDLPPRLRRRGRARRRRPRSRRRLGRPERRASTTPQGAASRARGPAVGRRSGAGVRAAAPCRPRLGRGSGSAARRPRSRGPRAAARGPRGGSCRLRSFR